MSFFGDHLDNYEELDKHIKKIKTSNLKFNYKVSLFYDNDENNFKKSSKIPIIVPILVSESKGNFKEGQYHDLMQDTLRKSKFNENKDSSKILDFLKTPGKTGKEPIDLHSGISIMQLYSLIEFIKKYRNNINVLIFDWDRTLTIVEGLLYDYPSLASKRNDFENAFPRDNLSLQFFKSGITNPDKRYIEAIFGGKERCYLLKKLYDLCNKMKLPIYIITNNGMLSSKKLKETKNKTDLYRNEIAKSKKGKSFNIPKNRNKYLPESRGEPDNSKQLFLEYLRVIGWHLNPDNIIFNNVVGSGIKIPDKYLTSIKFIEEISTQIREKRNKDESYNSKLNENIKDLLLSEKIHKRKRKYTTNNSNFRSMENIISINDHFSEETYKNQLLSIYPLF